MPRRSPQREPRRETSSRKSRGANGGTDRWSGLGQRSFVEDPMGTGPAEMRHVEPYQADKTYICPGCNQEIWPGTGHVVIVPVSDPTGRRHWHSPCWENRGRRHPTGR